MDNKPRKPWIAGLLSIIQPGLGHIYNGEIRNALIIYFLPVLLLPSMILCLHGRFIRPLFIAYALLGTVYYVYVFIDAVKIAKSHHQYLPKKYNKIHLYIGIYLLVVTLNVSSSLIVRTYIFQAFKIPAGSMEPTLLIGDHILVDKSKSAKNPKQGEIIVFEYPEDSTKDFVKRVVAIEGDTIEIKDKNLFVNGRQLQEPYIAHKESNIIPATDNPRDNLAPKVVPPGSYFTMGDNRDRSYDSRFWGFVPKDNVKGTVKNIYWSWDREKSAIRWDRIGNKVL